jgi:hypothetical protein
MLPISAEPTTHEEIKFQKWSTVTKRTRVRRTVGARFTFTIRLGGGGGGGGSRYLGCVSGGVATVISLGIRSSLGFRFRIRFRVGIRCRTPDMCPGC